MLLLLCSRVSREGEASAAFDFVDELELASPEAFLVDELLLASPEAS